MNGPRFSDQCEGEAFEALLNRHADRVMTWIFAKLAQRPQMCAVIADMLRQAEKQNRKDSRR